ncbi:uncharacterized protein [Palaemon carinicauda]|uniref:uncharacterized protein n=1 Tax=Palaemon carinicauda TaxID=392227 RepID=UPI0035B68276
MDSGNEAEMKVIGVLCVVCSLLTMILQILETSADYSVQETLFKKVMINGDDAKCSTEGDNYRTIIVSTTIPSATITCSVLCNMDDACLLFDTKDYACNLYSSVLSAEAACASGSTGTKAHTKILVEDLALFKSVEYSSTVTHHLVPFSDLTSNKTTYPSFHYCPCTDFGYNWIRIDLGQTYKIVRVDVTVSLEEREGSFKTVNILIGETGSINDDPVVGGKAATTLSELEVVEFNVKGAGRFVTLVQEEEGNLCCCKIQIRGY